MHLTIDKLCIKTCTLFKDALNIFILSNFTGSFSCFRSITIVANPGSFFALQTKKGCSVENTCSVRFYRTWACRSPCLQRLYRSGGGAWASGASGRCWLVDRETCWLRSVLDARSHVTVHRCHVIGRGRSQKLSNAGYVSGDRLEIEIFCNFGAL